MTASVSGAPAATGAHCCETVAATMIGHFATRLEVEARKAGGRLDATAIRAIAEHFLAEEAERFRPVYRRAFDTCTQAREARQWESARRRPFDRVLMKRFAHLFPPRSGDDGGAGVLSRRMIPGFNLAVDKLVGPALYEQCQRKSQGLLDRYRKAGGGWDWDKVHADPETDQLVHDVLTVFAHHFEAFERRRSWFMDLINSNLSPPQPGAIDLHWRLTDHGFAELMHALFATVRAQVRAEPDTVRNRYGEHTCEALRGFLDRLDRG